MNSIQKYGTCLLFFSLPVVATFKGKGTVILLLLAFLLFGISEILPFFKRKEWKKFFPLTPHKIYFWIGAMGAWIFLSIFWSPNILLELGHFGKLFAIILMSFFTYLGIKKMSPKDKLLFLKIFFYAFTLYILFYVLEIYGGGFFSDLYTKSGGYNPTLLLRGVIILSLFLVPFSLALRHFVPKKILRVTQTLLFLVLVAIFWKAQPRAATVAIIVGILSFPLVYWRKSFGELISFFIGATALFSPFIFVYFINEQTLLSYMHYIATSAQHRIQIWHDFSLKILNSPLLGYGFNFSSYVEGGRFRAAYYSNKVLKNSLYAPDKIIPDGIIPQSWGSIVYYGDSVFSRHPHNGFIQVWLELGFVGIILLVGLGYTLVRMISQIPNREIRAAGFTLFFMYTIFWCISFGIWQNWMISLVTLTIILFKVIKDIPKKAG
jgi:O-antigen ligase